MKKFLIVWLAFSFGYIAHDVINKTISPAHADVAGLDSYDLRFDKDFKQAVKYIVHAETAEMDSKISNLQNEVSFITRNLNDLDRNVTYLDGKVTNLENKMTYLSVQN